MAKSRKAWKLCSRCERSYTTVEYSLVCPACRKDVCKETGFSIATARSYDKRVWESSRDFDWTLIGLWDDARGLWVVEAIWDNWPQDLKDTIAAEGVSLSPSPPVSGAADGRQ